MKRDAVVADGGEKVELVLDYIVERKRMDDLAGSIVDGRFREQKVVEMLWLLRCCDWHVVTQCDHCSLRLNTITPPVHGITTWLYSENTFIIIIKLRRYLIDTCRLVSDIVRRDKRDPFFQRVFVRGKALPILKGGAPGWPGFLNTSYLFPQPLI